MDNVSHSLAGWALSRAAGSRPPAGTTLTLILASNLPDIDIVLAARSSAAYLLYHRGLTHSLVGLVVLPLVLAAGLWWAYGGRTRFRWFALLAACGVGLHLVYDVVTPWGTLLLYPFSLRRFALDWLFIVDLVTWALPLGAILVARRRPVRARLAVLVWLLSLATYGSAAGVLHRLAIGEVVATERAAGRSVAEAFAFPRPGAPWRWRGVAVSPASGPEPRLALQDLSGVPPRAAPVQRLRRGFDDPWVAAALATEAGQAYLWWARVPAATRAVEPGAVIVTLRDLRYGGPSVPTAETWGPFALRFEFDPITRRLVEVRW